MSGVNDIFGDPITAPGPAGINTGSVPQTVANLFSFGINLIFVIAGFVLLIQLLWGALDWTTSGGDEANLTKARDKMVNAILGLIIMVAALVIWIFIASNVLGTIRFEDGTIRFDIPSINGSGGSSGPGGGTGPGGGGNPGGGSNPNPTFPPPGTGPGDPGKGGRILPI